MPPATMSRSTMTHADEMKILRATSTRLLESFKDEKKGEDNLRNFLISAEILKKDGTAVPYFKGVFRDMPKK
jgi:hypothetical protein